MVYHVSHIMYPSLSERQCFYCKHSFPAKQGQFHEHLRDCPERLRQKAEDIRDSDAKVPSFHDEGNKDDYSPDPEWANPESQAQPIKDQELSAEEVAKKNQEILKLKQALEHKQTELDLQKQKWQLRNQKQNPAPALPPPVSEIQQRLNGLMVPPQSSPSVGRSESEENAPPKLHANGNQHGADYSNPFRDTSPISADVAHLCHDTSPKSKSKSKPTQPQPSFYHRITMSSGQKATPVKKYVP